MTARCVMPPCYTDTGADAITCPHCGAEPARLCTRPDGKSRRTPCLARMCHLPPLPDDEPATGTTMPGLPDFSRLTVFTRDPAEPNTNQNTD